MADLRTINEIIATDCWLEEVSVNGTGCVRAHFSDAPNLQVWQSLSKNSPRTGFHPIFVLSEDEPAWDIDSNFEIMVKAYLDSLKNPDTPEATKRPFPDLTGLSNAPPEAIENAFSKISKPDHPLAGAFKNIEKNFGIGMQDFPKLLSATNPDLKRTSTRMANDAATSIANYQKVQKCELAPLAAIAGDKKSPTVEDILKAADLFDLGLWLDLKKPPQSTSASIEQAPKSTTPLLSNNVILVPVQNAWEIPAVLRLGGESPWPHMHVAVWRHLYERYGIVPLSLGAKFGQETAYLYLPKLLNGENANAAANVLAAYSSHCLRAEGGDNTVYSVAASLGISHYWECFWG